jgi:signal transduction histidine kinase
VEIQIEHDGGAMGLQVADDGRGFDAAQPAAGCGLVGMRERVALLGGALDATSSARDTVVAARFPV